MTEAKMDKNELTYLNSLAISLLAGGFGDKAEPALELLNGQHAGHAAGTIGLASVALAKGDIDEACNILKQRSSQNQTDALQAKKMLMSAVVATNNFDHADTLMASLGTSAANDDEEYLRQSHRFFGTGDPRYML